jgi:hypothetical protein
MEGWKSPAWGWATVAENPKADGNDGIKWAKMGFKLIEAAGGKEKDTAGTGIKWKTERGEELNCNFKLDYYKKLIQEFKQIILEGGKLKKIKREI